MKKFLLSLAALAAFAPAFAGTGTQADPYTVADLLAMPVKVDGTSVTNIASAYVKGYIVGVADGKTIAAGAKFDSFVHRSSAPQQV